MMRKNGFTLIEVMISVLILSILASATYELMTQVVDSDIQIREKTERFAAVQRAFMLMEKDYTQMAPRMTRFDGGASAFVLEYGDRKYESDGFGISFVSGGALNPGAELPRGQLVRVWYRLKDGDLERATYSYADTIIGYEPKFEKFLSGVKDLKVYFYRMGMWSKTWNQRKDVPSGIRLEFELEDYGKMTLIYYVPAGV